jgi:hypothetical protein
MEIKPGDLVTPRGDYFVTLRYKRNYLVLAVDPTNRNVIIVINENCRPIDFPTHLVEVVKNVR